MVRTRVVIFLAALLPACTTLSDWTRLLPAPALAAKSEARPGHYNFSWRLSGDRAVAPLQVFDNGRQTWLQFAPGQALPAIFERTAAGDRPLTYETQGPYLVLAGVWPRLVLRGGHLTSYIDKVEDSLAALDADSFPDPAMQASSSPVDISVPASAPILASVPTLTPIPVPASPWPPAPAAVPAPTASALTAASFGPAEARPDQNYHVSPLDHNLRSALSRWAQAAGWTFEAEHWAVDADIPIVGSASFDSGFKPAVQELVAATELADRPLQPCFYSNRVLRIVPYAQSCDRTVDTTGGA